MGQQQLSKGIQRMVLIDKIAPRAGFVLSTKAGGWVRQWPSGKQWLIDQEGEWCYILDEHGRIIRRPVDGISVIGMLADALKSK